MLIEWFEREKRDEARISIFFFFFKKKAIEW